MMNNSKILTVSYGTFSCTLEGFDDSFGTMKAIAEYFRDLAADDRYFGAEPPQPDAEMLARIAEREVARKVQAREHEGKIVLSAIEDHADQPPEQARQATDQPDAPEQDVPMSELATPETDAIEPQDTVQAQNEDPAETVDETPEIHIASAAIAPEPSDGDHADPATPPSDGDAEAVATVDTVAALASDGTADAAGAAPVDHDVIDIVPGQPDAEVEAFFSEGAQVHTADETAFEEGETAPSLADTGNPPTGESIAEKLQRIRAVVSKTQKSDPTEAFLEDEHASTEPRSTEVLDAAVEDIQEALEADDATEAANADITPEDDAQEDDVAGILARLEQDDPVHEESAADTLLSEDADDVEAAEDLSDRLQNLFEDEDSAAETPQPVAKNITTTENLRTEVVSEASDEARSAPRARVVKVKRADLDAAIERGDLEEFSSEEETAEEHELSPLDRLAPSKTDQTSLSPDQEDELARELAALEADIDGDSDAEATSAKPEEQTAPSARGALPAIDDESEADMNRLLAEADHKMDEPESATRREAFSHLRAAVAAKKADVAMGGSTDEEKSDDAYRTDLAQVVRPRRPEGSGSKTPRPSEHRPAPLKLVAEQRVDAGRPQTEGPVRPRRVSAVKETTESAPGDSSFADYAQELGADTLPQLLEAAASYMSFVEGRDQFSRPQLMTKVRQAGSEDGFSREDGLRSFGQLLRSGKIEKIKGGRFTVSDDIGFRPDKRAAG